MIKLNQNKLLSLSTIKKPLSIKTVTLTKAGVCARQHEGRESTASCTVLSAVRQMLDSQGNVTETTLLMMQLHGLLTESNAITFNRIPNRSKCSPAMTAHGSLNPINKKSSSSTGQNEVTSVQRQGVDKFFKTLAKLAR
jgi:hypothetical protein